MIRGCEWEISTCFMTALIGMTPRHRKENVEKANKKVEKDKLAEERKQVYVVRHSPLSCSLTLLDTTVPKYLHRKLPSAQTVAHSG